MVRVLGIESTCDETGLALIEKKKEGFELLENLLISQVEKHRPFGGVYPSVAKREHQKAFPLLLKSLAEKRGKKKKRKFPEKKIQALKEILEREKEMGERVIEILAEKELSYDLLAVAVGPGLEPCLWVGINLAKILSFLEGKQVLLVNHLRAHLWANFLERPLSKELLPAVGLVVSGGHTVLVLIKEDFSFVKLGETRDDAAGECFDKTARLLGMPYPGGPEISKLADSFPKEASFSLPSPMIYSKNYDFSFSGLKTAVLYALEGKRKTKRLKAEMAKAIQKAIVRVLVHKTKRAVVEYKANSLWLGGGVVANRELQERMKKEVQERLGVPVLIPPKALIPDNALMIGIAGIIEKELGLSKLYSPERFLKQEALPNFEITKFF